MKTPEFYELQMQRFMDKEIPQWEFNVLSAYLIGEYKKIYEELKMREPKCVCQPDEYGHMPHCTYIVEKFIYDLKTRIQVLEGAIKQHSEDQDNPRLWEHIHNQV